MMESLTHTWPWYVSGFLIGLVMIVLTWLGKTFGMSSNLRTLCAIGGAGRWSSFFRYDHKAHFWNLVVVAGAMLGGYLAVHYLSDPSNVALNPETVRALSDLGIDAPEGKLAPNALFGNGIWDSPKLLAFLLAGGVLIGFGSRYAGGCTSGHAIQGLSNLQLPSLKAVIGFFVGGLVAVHFLLPLLF